MKLLLLEMLAAVSIGTASTACETVRIGATVSSYHFGGYSDQFEQFNPGITLGCTLYEGDSFEFGVQGGWYSNSYGEGTKFVLAYADWRIADFGPIELRAGTFGGMFEYPAIAAKMNNWPTIGDYVLVIGPTVKVRFDNGVDLNFGYIPLQSKKVKGIATFSFSIPFGGSHD